MKNNKAFWFILAIAVIWYYSKKLQAANALTVRYLLPNNIRISQGAIKCIEPIVITNPTGTPIDLQRYNLQIHFQGYPIGTGYGTILTTLQAGGDTTVLSNVVIPLSALISVIPDLLEIDKSLDFRFVGNITAEFLTIPVDTLIRIPIPKILREWI